jgi:N-acetylglucosamine malate deacetylase 1
MTHIAAIHAHPDDIEFLAAGTLAILAAKGHRITILTMTAGDCGSIAHGREETARIRMEEARRAAALIGAQYCCAEFGDLSVFNDDPSRRRTVEFLRVLQPALVITASPSDYHPDHEATSTLVRDACFAAPVPNYATGSAPPLPAIPHLYFMDPIDGRDRLGNIVEPDFGADIETTFETKRRMLKEHASQIDWVVKQHGIDNYTGAMEVSTRKRGKMFGVNYAEGFRHYKGTPYPTTPLLEELLGDTLLRAPA